MKVFFIGDIFGRPGRQMVGRHLSSLVDRQMIDLVVANAENAAAGFGVTADVVDELLGMGIDVLTTGNHVWDKRESFASLDHERRLLREVERIRERRPPRPVVGRDARVLRRVKLMRESQALKPTARRQSRPRQRS